jgi:hypothetical protein
MLAGLLDQHVKIVARGETEQPNAIWQIFRDLNGAGTDRARAAKENDVLHESTGVME